MTHVLGLIGVFFAVLWALHYFGQLLARSYIHKFNFIQIKGFTIHYREGGASQNPSLVLIHGMFSNQESWDKVRKKFEAHYHVISLDLPGMGESQNLVGSNIDAHQSLIQIEDLIYEFCQKLGLQNPHIMGCSLGGITAGLCYQKYPDFFQTCVLAAAPMNPKIMPLPIYKFYSLSKVLNLFVNPLIVFWTHYKTSKKNFTIKQSLCILSKFRRSNHFRSSMIYTELIIKADELLKTSWPQPKSTFFIWGTKDHLVKKKHFKAFLEAQPEMTFKELSKAAHHLMESDPEPFFREVHQFLSSTTKT